MTKSVSAPYCRQCGTRMKMGEHDWECETHGPELPVTAEGDDDDDKCTVRLQILVSQRDERRLRQLIGLRSVSEFGREAIRQAMDRCLT